MDALKKVVEEFAPISLEETNDCAKLMNRVDTKFVGSTLVLPTILSDLIEFYQILEIDQKRVLPYRTAYFDTSEFLLYNQHQNGKLNRYKIRKREYVNSGIQFLEIKFKNNKGRTVKKRIEEKNSFDDFSEEANLFLKKNSPYSSCDLEQKIINSFDRITLVSHDERLTIDFNLSFVDSEGNEKSFPEIMILEMKQSKFTFSSAATRILKSYGIRPDGFSKYCLGAASLNETIKSNNMKRKFRLIDKVK